MTESFDLGTLIEEFREEARGQLDRVDAGLLDIEREGALEEEARSELLRTLHTLKGNAGMLGLSAIRDYVHAMENVLKAELESWPEGVVERLFEGSASLRSAVEAAGTDREGPAFGELSTTRHRLEELKTGAVAPDPRTTEEGSEPEAPDTGDLVRVPFAKLDTLLAEAGELLGDAAGLQRSIRRDELDDLRDRAELLLRRGERIRESVMSLRLIPIGRILGRFHGLVRRLARQQGKEARLVVEGEATEMDKSTADALGEPLLHLVRNAIDHGIEPPDEREARGRPRHGTIWIRASQSGDRIRIEVADDGTGLDLDKIRERAAELGLDGAEGPVGAATARRLILEPGFSTRTDVSTVSGQGVGLDVVARKVRQLRGQLTVEESSAGGVRFVLQLPLTVAMVPSLVFEAAGEVLALPTASVHRTVRIRGTERVGALEVYRHDDEIHPVADADRLFGWPSSARGEFGVLVRRGGRSALLTAERLVEQRDLVVKAMPSYGARTSAVSGGSVLPGGRVILVLDPGELLRLTDDPQRGGRRGAMA